MTNLEKVIQNLPTAIRFAEHEGYNSLANIMRSALELLKEQTPQKKGYWINPTSLDCHCSECGNQPERESGSSIPLYNYCPYCGAEMEVKWDE